MWKDAGRGQFPLQHFGVFLSVFVDPESDQWADGWRMERITHLKECAWLQSILLWLTLALSWIPVTEFHLFCLLLLLFHVLQPASHHKSLQKSSPHLRWPTFLPPFRCRSGFRESQSSSTFSHHIKVFLNTFLGLRENVFPVFVCEFFFFYF